MSCHQFHEFRAVGRLSEVRHLVDDDVFQQILRLLHKFRIEADGALAAIAAAPLGLHALKVITGD